MRKKEYFDYTATTPMEKRVLKEMLPYLKDKYANAHSTYGSGIENAQAIEIARYRVAHKIGCPTDTIYFTSGATESNNWAIKSSAIRKMIGGETVKIALTGLDHDSVIKSVEFCEKYYKAESCIIPTNEFGEIDLKIFNDFCKKELPNIVVLTWVNNELGTGIDVKSICDIARKYVPKAYIHADATQAVPKFAPNLSQTELDSVAFSAHKVYGPKGIGALYLRHKESIIPFIDGGSQENGMRAGTSNTPAIVGFGIAMSLLDYDKIRTKTADLTSYLICKITNVFLTNPNYKDEISFTCSPDKYKNGIISLYFSFETRNLITLLDNMGVMVSTGSACTGEKEDSHVLTRIGKEGDKGLRISVSPLYTKKKDIDKLIKILKKALDIYNDVTPRKGENE